VNILIIMLLLTEVANRKWKGRNSMRKTLSNIFKQWSSTPWLSYMYVHCFCATANMVSWWSHLEQIRKFL